jgi:hypothetical protein
MSDVVRHPDYSMDEWDGAPQYWGPGTRELQEYGQVTVLDFERLEMLAELQRDRGEFKPDNGTDAQKAPVKVGAFLGNFVSIESLDEEDYLLHRPYEVEIFVVLKGLLEVERSLTPGMPRFSAPSRGILRQGDVVGLKPGELQLTAHGLEGRASSLALSILGLPSRQADYIITRSRFTMGKEFDVDFKPQLPYEPKEESSG